MRIIQSIALTLVAAVSVSAATPFGGDWQGVIKVQNQDLRLVLHIKEAAGKLTATFDSPDQYVAGMPVDTIELKGQTGQFRNQKDHEHLQRNARQGR
jgi:hypothetical protein